MKHSAYIYNELREISPFLAGLGKTNIFSVPENYFSGLHTKILNKIYDHPFYTLLPSESPLSSVPDAYFENLAGNILREIRNLENNNAAEELRQLSPILYSAQNENIFKVPERYFETFPATLLKIVRPKAKVVVMQKRKMLWNTAAAALLTGVMAIGALWISDNPSREISLATNNKSVPLNIKDALQYKNERQINEGIAQLSDTDIIEYLETTGSKADDEMLASGIEERELPNEKDYLTDENTLKMFLEKTEAKNNQN